MLVFRYFIISFFCISIFSCGNTPSHKAEHSLKRQITFVEQKVGVNRFMAIVTLTEVENGAVGFILDSRNAFDEKRYFIMKNELNVLWALIGSNEINKYKFVPGKEDSMSNPEFYTLQVRLGGNKKSYRIPIAATSEEAKKIIKAFKVHINQESILEHQLEPPGNKLKENSTAETISTLILEGFTEAASQDKDLGLINKKCIKDIDRTLLSPDIDAYLRKTYTPKILSEMNNFSGSSLGQRYLKYSLEPIYREYKMDIVDPIIFSESERKDLLLFFNSDIGRLYLKLLTEDNTEIEKSMSLLEPPRQACESMEASLTSSLRQAMPARDAASGAP